MVVQFREKEFSESLASLASLFSLSLSFYFSEGSAKHVPPPFLSSPLVFFIIIQGMEEFVFRISMNDHT